MNSSEVTEAVRTDIWSYIRTDNIDAADKEHRFIFVYSYLITYLATSKPIRIVRVLHAARDV